MEGSYLLTLYSSLNADERTAFGLFLHGNPPRHWADKCLLLENCLAKAAPGFEGEKLGKALIFKQIFTGEPYREGRLDKVMVELTRMLKSWLLHRHYDRPENEVRRQLDWIHVLRERGLHQTKASALSKLQKMPARPRNRDVYHEQFCLDVELFSEQTIQNALKGDLHVPQALESLERYYHIARLELLNHLLLQRRVTNLSMPEPGHAVWSNMSVPEDLLRADPVLLISFKISELLQQEMPPLADFETLSALLQAHEAAIAPELLRQFYTHLRNGCAFRINAGAHDLLPIFHQLQRDNLERGYLYQEGKRISASAYLSLTNAAVKVGNIDWALQFVETHQHRVIGENDQHELYKLNLAQCLFAREQFDQALDLIAPAFEYLNYTLIAKRLEIKILYETESDLLPYKTAAFKTFLIRASQTYLPEGLRKPNADFVNAILQLIRSKPGRRIRSERLKARIQEKPQIAEKEWLLDKIARLK